MYQLEPKEVSIAVQLQDKKRRSTNFMPWKLSIKYRPFNSNLLSQSYFLYRRLVTHADKKEYARFDRMK